MNQDGKGDLPILKQHLVSTDRYLRPEAIYSLNRVLYEFLDTLKISTPEDNGTNNEDGSGHRAWVVPFLFDQYSRSWHFACVLPHVWEDHSNHRGICEVTKEILWLLVKMAFEPYWANFGTDAKLLAGKDFEGAYKRIVDAVETIRSNNSFHEKYLNQKLNEDICLENLGENWAEEVAKIVQIIDQVGNPRPDNVRSLVRDALLVYHGICVHRGVLLPGVLRRKLLELDDGEVLLRLEGKPKIGEPLLGDGELLTTKGNRVVKKMVEFKQTIFDLEDGKPFRADLGLHQWTDLAQPFYLKEVSAQQQLHLEKTGSALPFLVLPIYDTWLGNVGYGGLWGCLLCTFLNENSRSMFVKDVLEKLKPVCEILSAELTMSALATISSIPIIPPYDLIEHFVKVIVHIQDWERVNVRSNNSGKTLYCYKRLPFGMDYMNGFSWERCTKPNESCEQNCGGGERFSWKDLGIVTILSNEFIPELSPEEVREFGDIYIEFEYSKTAVVPQKQRGADKTDKTHDLFKFAVIQRQIEVLRALIPKVRARRAALRSAVSAIMGRNMSHNIGSHVLARYSNEVKKEMENTDSKLKDHREAFLRYLQRRMDFIAEVATTDQSFWSQALSIEGTLDKLNLDKEDKAINGNNGSGVKKPILLSYITGKEVDGGPLTATVEIDDATDGNHRYFACPSGEVGVHALYVIFENIIRNSARHNERPSCPITVQVKIDQEKQYPDLWKLTLTDLQTSAINERSGNRYINDEINSNLKEEILNSDGAPNPKYWGIREMQVCAQYLRNLPLSDLEGPQPNPPVLEAVNNEDCLAYVIYLPRAKLCVIVSKSPLVEDAQKKYLRAKGFDFVSSEGRTDAKLADALRGYAYAIIEEGVQGIPQASTIEMFPNNAMLGDHWVKKIDWPVRTLSLPRKRLEKLIFSLPDQTGNIQGQSVVSESTTFDPMKWIEDQLHSRLVDEYQNRREYLKNKNVAVKVGWEASDAIINDKFEHTKIDSLKSWEGEVGPLLCWIDHAKAVHFTGSPFLRAACEETVVESQLYKRKRIISSWIYAEVIRSHSPHHHELQSQLAKKISGYELIAAALAKVAIIDERVQSMAGENNDEIEYSTLWSCMGIWVPSTKQANLNFPAFEAICSFLKEPAQLLVNMPIDFVVLHLTILEKLAQELGCDEQSALNQLISCAGLLPDCEVVIVTGRGVPAVARHEASKRLSARYLPISALLEYLVSNPSKIAVMRALWSAATSKTNE